jgi:FKBP-type peptidyl-prolyl cis-trans isomerase SlyD
VENQKPTQIAQDIVVHMAYQLTVDEKVEEAYNEEEPIIFIFGHDNIIPGLESELQGMKIGDTKDVTVQPVDAYGEFNEEALIDVPLSQFPSDIPLSIGTLLELKDDEGNPLTASIAGVTDEDVQLDFNHPMAGKILNFMVKIIDLRQADPDEIETGQVQLI